MTCKLIFLSVGNADSIVIQDENSLILVDLGNLNVLAKWLHEQRVSSIDRIYITHDHKDHFPSLVSLANFLNDWLKIGTIEKLHLPYRAYEVAKRKVLLDRKNTERNPKLERLELALNRITDWRKESSIKLTPIVQDGEEYCNGSLQVKALHPSQDYIENHLAVSSAGINEISIVLQVIYGDFSALLLADIEKAGLAEFLKTLKRRSSDVTGSQANVVKIPHHGAYPENGEDLQELLALINAEVAILSVGSKNTYGHVEPKLFKTLIELQDSQHLKRFLCTEVTRTCVHSAADYSSMGKRGLSVTEKCAGTITIVADTLGIQELQTEIKDHAAKIASFNHAACDRRADLS